MRTFLIILVIFPITSLGAIGDIGFSNTRTVTTNSGTVAGTVHRVTCPYYFTLETHGFQMRSVSGSPTLGFYYNGIWKASTTINTTPSWRYVDVDLPCTSGYIDFTVVGGNYYSYQTDYTGTSATTSPVNVQNLTSSQYNTFYTLFSLPLNVTSGSSSDMGTTTVILQNDQLINFWLLFTFCFMVIFGIIMLLKPFYARK